MRAIFGAKRVRGKRGRGAAGNLIVGATGELLAIDIVDFGFGYTAGVRPVISDNCGKGRAGRVRARIGKIKKSKRVIIKSNPDIDNDEDIIVIEPPPTSGVFDALNTGTGATEIGKEKPKLLWQKNLTHGLKKSCNRLAILKFELFH